MVEGKWFAESTKLISECGMNPTLPAVTGLGDEMLMCNIPRSEAKSSF